MKQFRESGIEFVSNKNSSIHIKDQIEYNEYERFRKQVINDYETEQHLEDEDEFNDLDEIIEKFKKKQQKERKV